VALEVAASRLAGSGGAGGTLTGARLPREAGRDAQVTDAIDSLRDSTDRKDSRDPSDPQAISHDTRQNPSRTARLRLVKE